MLNLVTWPRNPWSIFDELDSLEEDMDLMLSGRKGPGRNRGARAWRRRPTYPLLNVWSSEDGLVIDAELPGVDPNDVDISVMGDELTLRGTVNATDDSNGDTYHRRERPAGEFVRTLQLPFRAESAAVKANYRNGVLRLTVPRAEAEKAKRITIEAS